MFQGWDEPHGRHFKTKKRLKSNKKLKGNKKWFKRQ